MQQVALGASYLARETEGGVSSGLAYLGNGCLAASGIMFTIGLTTPAGTTPTPVSLGYWIATGAVFL